jgi:Spy/CpxP family protein refolding chaperone
MMWRVLLPAAVIVLVQSATPAHAQLRPRRDAALPRGGAGRNLQGNPQVGGNRAQLERQFQQMLYQMTRRRVGLTDAQMNRLVPVNRRFETQRRDLQRQERQTRLALRDAMRDSAQADQAKISGYLDQLTQLQRQRVELFAQEQRDLAEFMTPLQRARYTALQEQVRRRVEQMRRQNGVIADSTLGKPPGH